MIPVKFDMEWRPPRDESTHELTRGRLHVTLNGKTVWGKPGGIESTWLGFLDHLILSWPYITGQEGNPWGFASNIEDLYEFARKQWDDLPPVEQEVLEDGLYFYLNTHDLGDGFQGMYVPQLYVTKEGGQFRWASIGQVGYTSESEGIQILLEIGNQIASRLEKAEGSDRTSRTLSNWKRLQSEANGEVPSPALSS